MERRASLYRMKTDEHICPFGLKAKDLLEREGFEVDDHLLRSREETDDFKEEHEVETTPQVFIAGERIGGYSDLRAHFDMDPEKREGTTYVPVIAVFAVSALCALALAWSVHGTVLHLATLTFFVAMSMAVLAIQKLRDLRAFTNSFITYDLLGMRVVRYAYVYPFAEAFVAIGMFGQGAFAALPFIVAPVALFIGGVGAISVFKAVYIDERDLKCACVGGGSDVPLGFVSLSENLAMVGMGVWMLVRAFS